LHGEEQTGAGAFVHRHGQHVGAVEGDAAEVTVYLGCPAML